MKSILLVGNFPPKGNPGIRHVCEELAENLELQGWRVLRTPQSVSRLGRLIEIVTTIVLRSSTYQIAHIDVYSGPAFRIAEIATSLLSMLRKKVLLSWHGGDLPGFAARHPSRIRRLLRKSHAQTAPSTYLLEQIPVKQPLAKVIPNGLYIDHYPFRHRKTVSGRLIWLRAFKDLYNPLLAVELVACLRNRGHQVSMIMAGPNLSPHMMEQVRERISKHKIADFVDIRSAIAKSDVPGFLQQGDIFINTSRIDNTPVSVIEAMACGLCVVSSDVGGLPYLLTHGYDALLAESNHAQSFADQVESLIFDANSAARLSRNARQTVEQFDWSIVAPKWQALLKEISESKQ